MQRDYVIILIFFGLNICTIQKKVVILRVLNIYTIIELKSIPNMKKLLLLFSVVLFSLTVCGQALNPYAYDLKSTWNGTTRKLTISFMLNAKPNLDTSKGGAGIQIYAYDPSNPNQQYYICGPSGTDINNKGVGPYSYTITFDANGKADKTGVTVPLNTKLSWRVNVNGENEGSTNGRKAPVVVLDATANRSHTAHGVAVDKCTESPNFGQIYITETNSTTWGTSSVWYWMNAYTRPCVWIYKPNLTIKGNFVKTLQDGSSVSNFSAPEPHRVRVSADGRVFVSSFHTNSSTAVWEYTGSNNFNRIISRNTSTDGRVVGIDVTGSGDGLKILVCYLTDNTLTFKEYPIGTKSGLYTGTVTAKGSFTGTGILKSNNDALANVAYNDNGDTFWFAWDSNTNTASSQSKQSYVKQMIKNGTSYQPATWVMTMPQVCGSAGLYVKGDLLVKATCSTGGQGTLRFYQITSSGTLTQKYSPININTMWWVHDIAADYAGNLYFTSAWRGNALAVAMPYNGLKVTPAPSSCTFAIADPIPNILATDLRYVPHPYLDSYYFSFNVNTKPAKAVFRFYKSYDDMKKSINVVHDDLYDGTNAHTPDFIYEVPASKLRLGKIEVEFAMAGGKIVDGKITEPILPPGEWYWSVYVEAPRRSTSFAPIFWDKEVVSATEGNMRKHATVNNYPETDMFGAIIVGHNPSITSNDATRPERGLWIYGVNPDGNNDATLVSNESRYKVVTTYLNKDKELGSDMLNYPRRMTVGEDGKVYIADEGNETTGKDWKVGSNGYMPHEKGGVKIWDPARPNRFGLFSDNKIRTSTGVALYKHSSGWKLYATNTYNEYYAHCREIEPTNYTTDQENDLNIYGWNGFVEYTLSKYTSGHNGSWASWGSDAKEIALRRGDCSGNMSVVAMDKGIWMCQHREHTIKIKRELNEPLADNMQAYILSFVPYGSSTRTWKTNNSNGVLNSGWDPNRSRYSQCSKSQGHDIESPLQSTPGAGMAYQKIKVGTNSYKEFIYVVNHDGNIAELEITGWFGSGASATPVVEVPENIQILETPETVKGISLAQKNGYYDREWKTSFITSMNFDYAGNLVTTTGKKYWDGPQGVLVYTMPYPNRVNAQEIQAPNSCRFIPERLSQNNMEQEKIDDVIVPYLPTSGTCYLDLYRPLQGGTFNTITLPFDLASLNNTPYAGAEVRRFTGTELKNVGGENLLYFNFEKVTFSGDDIMKAGQPYVIMPQNDVVGIVSFKNARVQFKTQYSTELTGGDEYGKFVGFFPYREMASDPMTLMLVSDNRLAEIEEGTMNGFRAYFHLLKAVPANTLSMLHFKKDAPTGMEIVVDGKVVNVEKLIREGRVYIRAGETLYTITGEVVGR